jgi:hypothetical protein
VGEAQCKTRRNEVWGLQKAPAAGDVVRHAGYREPAWMVG